MWKSTDFFVTQIFREINSYKFTKLEKRTILDNLKTKFSPKLKLLQN